jgi:hypothetical protein
MISRTEVLAQQLARTRRAKTLGFFLSVVLALSALGLALGLPLLENRKAFNEAREDFLATWCGTWGVDPGDLATDEWRAYFERHEPLLRANSEVLSMYGARSLDGSEVSEDALLWTVEQGELGIWQLEQYWFQLGFPQYFGFFDFGGSWGSPPNC